VYLQQTVPINNVQYDYDVCNLHAIQQTTAASDDDDDDDDDVASFAGPYSLYTLSPLRSRSSRPPTHVDCYAM